MSVRTAATVGLLAIAVISGGCGRQVSFSADIQPILKERCASCHLPGGEGYAKSGFSVASYQTLMKGTKYGEVVIPGSAVGSTLMRLVQHEADPSIAMPKNEVHGMPSNWLTRSQIKLLGEWIDQGAKDN